MRSAGGAEDAQSDAQTRQSECDCSGKRIVVRQTRYSQRQSASRRLWRTLREEIALTLKFPLLPLRELRRVNRHIADFLHQHGDVPHCHGKFLPDRHLAAGKRDLISDLDLGLSWRERSIHRQAPSLDRRLRIRIQDGSALSRVWKVDDDRRWRADRRARRVLEVEQVKHLQTL